MIADFALAHFACETQSFYRERPSFIKQVSDLLRNLALRIIILSEYFTILNWKFAAKKYGFRKRFSTIFVIEKIHNQNTK